MRSPLDGGIQGNASTIAARLEHPANGFTILRLLLALAVVVSHGVSVASGRVEDEPLFRLTGFTLGEHAVNGFFAVSGFLVTMSFCRRGPRDYVLARALRIAPGLIAATFVVALGLGPMLTTLQAASYLRDPGVWHFVAGTLTTFKSNAALPGLFAANPFRFPMGTVWTLKFEVICYAGVLGTGFVGLLRSRFPAAVATSGLALALLVTDAFHPEASKGLQTAMRLPFLFTIGSALYLWRDRAPLSGWFVAAAICLTALLARTPAYHAALFATEAYGIVWLALSPVMARPSLDFGQDLSYGVYLYGWPIQQAILQSHPGWPVASLLASSLALTLVVAALSWFLVEKPALGLKARALERRTLQPGKS